MKNTNPNKFNIVIAILSVAAGVIYFFSTMPAFIEQLECSNCGTVRDMSFMHYWYRWVLFVVVIIGGIRLFMNLRGTRRMYYFFFAGLLSVAIHDMVKDFALLNISEMVLDVVTPIIISVLGFVYFKTFYMSSLKRG